MRKALALIALLGAIALLTGGRSPAQDKKGAADAKAQIEAMLKAGQPGENHKRLEALAGSWDVAMTMWMDPSQPPSESKGTVESKMIFEGRFLEEKVTGEFGGQKVRGQAVTGYDNVQKKYTSAWIDNMGTGITTSTGTYDPDKKTFTFTGEEIDPLSGQKFKIRGVIHLIDKDKYENDMYREMGGKEVKTMHLTYTRKAGR